MGVYGLGFSISGPGVQPMVFKALGSGTGARLLLPLLLPAASRTASRLATHSNPIYTSWSHTLNPNA